MERFTVHLCLVKHEFFRWSQTTDPRLELTAATTSTKVATQLKKEVTIKPDFETFWTVSKVVLGYISNSSKKFHLFVTNRIQAIHLMFNSGDTSRQTTTLQMTREVNQSRNSLRINVGSRPRFPVETFEWEERRTVCSRWKWCRSQEDQQVFEDWSRYNNQFENLFQRTSSWYRLKRVIAIILSWWYKKKTAVDLLLKAELAIVKLAQRSFGAPIEQ